MTRSLAAIVTAITLLAPVPALALSYSFAELNIPFVESDNNAPDGDGIGVGISKELGEHFYGFMQWTDYGFEETQTTVKFDLTTFEVGLGYHFGIGEKTDLLAEAAFTEVDADGSTSADDDGYRATLGIRSRIFEKVEAELRGNHVEFGGPNDDTNGEVRFRYYFRPGYAWQAGGLFGDDANVYTFSMRFEFGNK